MSFVYIMLLARLRFRIHVEKEKVYKEREREFAWVKELDRDVISFSRDLKLHKLLYFTNIFSEIF